MTCKSSFPTSTVHIQSHELPQAGERCPRLQGHPECLLLYSSRSAPEEEEKAFEVPGAGGCSVKSVSSEWKVLLICLIQTKSDTSPEILVAEARGCGCALGEHQQAEMLRGGCGW